MDDEDLTRSELKTQTSCYYSESLNIFLSFFRLILLFRFPPILSRYFSVAVGRINLILIDLLMGSAACTQL